MYIRCSPNFKVCYHPVLRNDLYLENQIWYFPISFPTVFSPMVFSLVWEGCHSETALPTSTWKCQSFSRPFHASSVFPFKLVIDSMAVTEQRVDSQNQDKMKTYLLLTGPFLISQWVSYVAKCKVKQPRAPCWYSYFTSCPSLCSLTTSDMEN